MSSGPADSGFKYVFWGILLVIGLAFVGVMFFTYVGRVGLGMPHPMHVFSLTFFAQYVPLVLLPAAYVVIVGSLVYRDATRRGMDPWLWTTVAVFVPCLIGVVIYLVVRANGQRCVKCGEGLRRDFKVCPYCGQPQELQCPECRGAVAVDWKLCPRCGQVLTQG